MTRTFNHFKKTMLLAAVVLPAFLLSGCQEKESPVTTELKLESSTLNVPAEGGDAVMNYTVTNPIEGAKINAGSQAGWLHDFDCSEEGRIRFIVDENPEVGQTRTATVTVSYNDGTIEDEFTVLQGEGVEKAPFEITIDEVGMDYAIATIAPLDPEMTWHALAYDAWVFDEEGRPIEQCVEEFLNAYAFVASMAGMDFETFMETDILCTGTETLPFEQLSVGTKHYIMAIGIDAKGTILSDAVLEPFTTEGIDMQDITFEVSFDVDGVNGTLHTIPSDNNVRYYTDIKLKSDWPDGPDIQGWLQTYMWQESILGISREEAINKISSYGDATKEYYLDKETDYYAFAVAINEQGIICSDAEVVEFTSGTVPPSDNTFMINVIEEGADYVDYEVIPSNNDYYSYAVSPVSEWDGMTDEEYVRQYISTGMNLILMDMKTTFGENSFTESGLAPNTDYYIFVFGYEQQTITTEITKMKVSTVGADNPEDLTFTFETSNITSTSVNVKVVGTPSQALYYWDIAEASASADDIRTAIDARAQHFIDIGYMPDLATLFQQYGTRGTAEEQGKSNYEFSYNSIEPGKEYKLYAVGIYDETGEYATDFVFSEPFTTPAS